MVENKIYALKQSEQVELNNLFQLFNEHNSIIAKSQFVIKGLNHIRQELFAKLCGENDIDTEKYNISFSKDLKTFELVEVPKQVPKKLLSKSVTPKKKKE